MGKEKVQIIITGQDKASRPIGKVNKALSGMATVASGMIAAQLLTGVASGIAQIGASMTKLVSLGSDAEEMMGKFNVVFGEFAQGTISDLNAMAAEMGRSKFEMREFAASFQDTFVPLGFARGEAAKFSKQLVELTYDVASFQNSLEPDVARDFQSAMVGNHETVRKYGIVITQVSLNQELLNMGINGGIKSATEQQKVLARLNIIMAGTSDAHGDAVRTAHSWANQTRRLRANLNDLSTELGSRLLPKLTPVVERLAELVEIRGPEMLELVSEAFIEPIGKAALAAGELFEFLAAGVIEMGKLRRGSGEYAEAVTAAISPDVERMQFQLDLLRELVEAQDDRGDSLNALSLAEQEAVQQATMMHDAMVPLTAVEQALIMHEADLEYETWKHAQQRDKLLGLLTKGQKRTYELAIAEFDLDKTIEKGNRIRDRAAQRWQGLGEAMATAGRLARETALTYATPVGMHIPMTPEERAWQEVDAFIRAGNRIAAEREKNEADAKSAAEDYWREYERLGKEAWGKIQGLISGSFKQTEDWIRVALQGTSADLGDAWDEMARRAEAVVGDVEKTGTSPWLTMFDIPQDILEAGGDQLKAFMTKLAADIRDSPTVRELGAVGIDAMVDNIKKELADQIGMADLEQTVALKLASDPEAVTMMNQLGIDIDAAMKVNENAIVGSIDSLKTTTLNTSTTNFPALLTNTEETNLLNNVTDAIKGLYDQLLDVTVTNWSDFTSELVGLLPRYSFQSGGIVPGPTGAPTLAQVEGGEMILNSEQQQQLMFNLTVNSSAPVSSVIQDFNMLKSLAGVA